MQSQGRRPALANGPTLSRLSLSRRRVRRMHGLIVERLLGSGSDYPVLLNGSRARAAATSPAAGRAVAARPNDRSVASEFRPRVPPAQHFRGPRKPPDWRHGSAATPRGRRRNSFGMPRSVRAVKLGVVVWPKGTRAGRRPCPTSVPGAHLPHWEVGLNGQGRPDLPDPVDPSGLTATLVRS